MLDPPGLLIPKAESRVLASWKKAVALKSQEVIFIFVYVCGIIQKYVWSLSSVPAAELLRLLEFPDRMCFVIHNEPLSLC